MMLMNNEAALEAVLFAAGDPVPLQALADALELDAHTAKMLVLSLSDKYEAEKRGILIKEVDGAFQMRTNPEYYRQVGRTARQIPRKPLSQAALETLAIIAYRQPITKAEVEQIRGVDTGHALNKLLECGLVSEKGRKDAPGKPILFATSDLFLTHFGLANLAELPTMDEDLERLKREAEDELSLLT